MTKEEFERYWVEECGFPDALDVFCIKAVPCECGEAGCKGWQMITDPDPDRMAEAFDGFIEYRDTAQPFRKGLT